MLSDSTLLATHSFQNHSSREQTGVTGVRGTEMKSYCLIGTEFRFEMMKKF
jgi:hypothetical protein